MDNTDSQFKTENNWALPTGPASNDVDVPSTLGIILSRRHASVSHNLRIIPNTGTTRSRSRYKKRDPDGANDVASPNFRGNRNEPARTNVSR
jgi:hypothetical protein